MAIIRKYQVLLVEDDDDIRIALAEIFENKGYIVKSICDGACFADTMATTLLLENSAFVPDVIITDVCLPGFDGLGIVSGLRHAGWKTPVFVVSALPIEDIQSRVQHLPAVFVYQKPVDVDELERAVKLVIDDLAPMVSENNF